MLLIDPNHFTVGASGAVFGVMGAAVAVFRARGVNIMDSGLGATIFLNLALTSSIPGISIGGHVGGLITGYVAGELLMSIGPQFLKDQRLAVASVVAPRGGGDGGIHHCRLTSCRRSSSRRTTASKGRRYRDGDAPAPSADRLVAGPPVRGDVLLAVAVTAVTLPSLWSTGTV